MRRREGTSAWRAPIDCAVQMNTQVNPKKELSAEELDEQKKKNREKRKARFRLVALTPKLAPWMTVALVFLIIVGAIASTLFTLWAGRLVGGAQEVALGLGREKLDLALKVVAFLFVFEVTVNPVRAVIGDMIARRINGRIRARLIAACAMPAGIAHLEDPAWQDRISTAKGVGNSEWTPGGAVLAVTNQVYGYLQGLGAAYLLLSLGWYVPVGLVAMWLWVRGIWRTRMIGMVSSHIGETAVLRRANYFKSLSLKPLSAKETRVFGLKDWIGGRFVSLSNEALKEVWAARRSGLTSMGGTIIVIGISHLVLFAFIGQQAIAGNITIEQVAVFAPAVFGVLGGFLNIGDDALRIEYGAASIPVMEDLERRVAEPDLVGTGSRPADGFPTGNVSFQNVSFTYPGRTEKVFDGLDLTIEAGKSLGIVGSNGAGKTTLVKLLGRLYDPQEGSVSADGVDLKQFDATSWQRRMAAIFQDFVKYQLTASDNIGFGSVRLGNDPEALARAAQRAGATTIIDELPSKWDTVLSRQYTGGMEPSGGQWQRIALARAMFAVEDGASLLVLDEPAANLDVRAESELYDRFLDMTSGLTTVVISHRFSTVRRADRIVVLEHGRVVEDGTHEQLLTLDGIYARMFRLQASRYIDEDVDANAAENGEGGAE